MSAADTYLLLRAFCDELARCGLQHACTSPGSRSAPLVLSLVREPRITCWSHIDERCAAFFALGAAKASGRPVAVACTSGTAAANLSPAVIEAYHARVPLLILSADRPAQLREVGAGQTIDQLKLYGSAVKWFFEVEAHEATPPTLRWIRTLACRAYWTALERGGGPVHLNFPLAEPLVLDAPLPEDQTARGGNRPFIVADPSTSLPTRGHGPHPSERVVIVAGSGCRDPEALAAFAARAGIPLLADPLSGARSGPAAIAHYDLLLRDERFADAHRPRFVIRTGELPTSKPLRAWLARLDAAQIAVDPDRTWQDPDSVVGMRIPTLPLPADLEALEPGWLAGWRPPDSDAGAAIDEELGDALSEPLVARRLGGWLPSNATMFVASSMPVRDLETFAPVRDHAPRTLANRGANGIDGTVSSAFGITAAAAGPVVALCGDVALLHDIGGLLAARRLGLGPTIVVLNNDGGGIFHFLPLADERDAFEEHVATPHGLELGRVATLFDCGYERPQDPRALQAALEQAITAKRATIIEVRTTREENLALHRRVARAAIPDEAKPPGAAAAPGA